MKKLSFLAAAFFAVMAPMSAFAVDYVPNQNVTFIEFVESRGCVVIDKGGYLTFKGGCPAAAQFTVTPSILVDRDNDPSTPDVWIRDN